MADEKRFGIARGCTDAEDDEAVLHAEDEHGEGVCIRIFHAKWGSETDANWEEHHMMGNYHQHVMCENAARHKTSTRDQKIHYIVDITIQCTLRASLEVGNGDYYEEF